MFLPSSPQNVGSAVFKAIADHLAGFKVLGVTRAESAVALGTVVTVVGELALMPEAAAAVPGAVRSRGQVLFARAVMHLPCCQLRRTADMSNTAQVIASNS